MQTDNKLKDDYKHNLFEVVINSEIRIKNSLIAKDQKIPLKNGRKRKRKKERNTEKG